MPSALNSFNENLERFLDVIRTNFPEQRSSTDAHYIFPIGAEDKTTIELFWANCSSKGDDISSKNEIIFSKGIELIPHVDMNQVWNSPTVTEEHRDTIWRYIHALYIYAFEHNRDLDFQGVLRLLKSLNMTNKDIDEDVRTIYNIIDHMSIEAKAKEAIERGEGEPDEAPKANGGIGGFDFSKFELPKELLSGPIGQLAQEIAQEISPEAIQSVAQEDPKELLNTLLNTNLDDKASKHSGLFNLVRNITDKIQTKISNGDIDQDKLFGEAQKMMGSFGKMGGNLANMASQMAGGGGNSDMMSTLQQMMSQVASDLPEGSGTTVNDVMAQAVRGASNILQQAQTNPLVRQQISQRADLAKQRDRLRAQLEKKRQERQKQ
jgi:hypothetical protein